MSSSSKKPHSFLSWHARCLVEVNKYINHEGLQLGPAILLASVRVRDCFRSLFLSRILNPKLTLKRCIYMLICRQGPYYQCVSDQSRPAFVQSHFQGQARVTFVTALELHNFDCAKNSCIFYLKPSSALEAPDHGHQLGLTYSHEIWTYPGNEDNLGHCGLSAASRVSTSWHFSLLTTHGRTAPY